jgi:hypothetical protein
MDNNQGFSLVETLVSLLLVCSTAIIFLQQQFQLKQEVKQFLYEFTQSLEKQS